ncbi:PhoX family protein [Vallicoccus soli]|uniref:PhoX family phosphatase n=1 Tax=Vallicoccus soli TaxID=2339232 RepID=A0A3A3YXM6_9ACTN|nr:PhoX family phosphatase [Vallicoccus soli]RJK96429.1 PhoX family phosphatase [Vallicoccus soli]
MTETPERATRRLLPLLQAHSGRSRTTCRYRCADACFHAVPNTSGNPYFGDLVAEAVSRRGVLKAGAAALVLGTGAATAAGGRAAAAEGASGAAEGAAAATRAGGLTFSPVGVNTLDTLVVPNGYDWSVLVAWGDPVEEGAPHFDPERQSPQAQAKQFGYNCDYVTVFAFPGDPDRALLWVNHEYTNEELMFPGWEGAASATVRQIRTSMAAHGGSVVEIERVGRTGEWRRAKGRRWNRRITAMTPMAFTGPAAGSPLLRTSEDRRGLHPVGMINNCAGGHTPWETVLTGEENFNGYFTVPGLDQDGELVPDYSSFPPDLAEGYARYGVGAPTGTEFAREWARADRRFDMTQEPNEPHRFGWVVQIDPWDPTSTPRKLTALGRCKHEGATTAITRDGRVAVYMGDDERFEYTYKFISKGRFRAGGGAAARRHNMALLDEGDLYVARYDGDSPDLGDAGDLPEDGLYDGRGRWVPLVVDGESRVPGMSVDEVLVLTRTAADRVGATRMDRPEDMERNPVNGKVYVNLTNNTQRGTEGRPGPDEANPRPVNRHGHTIEITERDPGALGFRWQIFLLAGDPADPQTYFAGADKSRVSPISCPDNLTFDPAGNLWLATDGNALGANDGMFAAPVSGPDRGVLKQFLTVPVGAECCGPLITADGRTALCAVQHPGEGDGSTYASPMSTWPYGGLPRPSVVSVWRTAPGDPRIGA